MNKKREKTDATALLLLSIGLLIAAILLAVTLFTNVAQAKPASVLLQEGLYAEEVEGNLDAAIEIYEKAVIQSAKVEKTAARATYRIGMCYLKKGEKDKAADYFEQITTKFGQQKALAERAQKQLAKLRPLVNLQLTFGEVIEREIEIMQNENDAFSRKCLIDFETGRLFSLPDRFRQMQDDPDGNGKFEEFVYKWCKKNGIDTCAYQEDNLAGFVLEIGKKLGVFLDIDNTAWDSGQPGEVIKQIKEAQRLEDEIKANQIPDTFGFRTSEGNFGLVQILGFDNNKMNIRYKMLQEFYTQKFFADVGSDGTLNFETTVRMVNESSSPVESRSFINSDFVKVTAMQDSMGQPIKFTTVHEGNHWRYHVTFNKPVAPGGMIVYSHEGTMTGLIKSVPDEKDTFQYYMRHHPNSGRATLRIETYLLPESAELLSTTPADMQRREKDGRIELYVKETIPTGGSITTAFKYRIPGGQLAKTKPLDLIPAPFFDGEVMRLKLSTQVGAEIGQVIYETEVVEQDGKYLWRILSYIHIAATNMQQYTEVYADRMTLVPISSRTKNWLGDFRAAYSPGSVKLTSKTTGTELTKNFVPPGPVYDNEQALYVIRALPLKEGYSASFDIFPVQSGVISECRIRVTGTEKLTFIAGEIECFAIELSVYAQGIKALTHHLWISTDEHHWLVKYDSGAAVMELLHSGSRDKDQSEKVIDTPNGYSFELPYGWHCVPSQGQRKAQSQLLSPELKAWAAFLADERPALVQSIRKVAQGDIERLKGFFKDYTLRADSLVERNIASLPAAQYVADYEDKGLQMSEYRTYILGESLLYWFVFRIQRDQFDRNRPEFDLIINSFGKVQSFGSAEPKAVSVSAKDKRAAENLSANGWQLWGQRKLAEAQKVFERAVDKDPGNANAWNGLGWSQFNQGKNLNAKESFEKCLEIEPKHAAALNGLGWIAKAQNKVDEAIGHWEKAVKAAPTATASLNGLATTYMERKDYDKAVKYYRMWLDAEPKNADAKAGLEKAKTAKGSR